MWAKHPVVLLLVVSGCLATKEWNYVREDTRLGPFAWASNFPNCGGEENSPINIISRNAVQKYRPSWQLTGWDDVRRWSVRDKSYTVQFDLLDFGGIRTSGGMLGSEYVLAQFHFHWGARNDFGSEHTVDGRSYPLEAHLVHIRKDFTSAEEALGSGERDAIAVLGIFFEVGYYDNPKFEPIVKSVRQPSSDTTIGTLSTIFNQAITGDFWRYDGGLTTPGCFEQVKWTVFKTPIRISRQQIEAFRTIDDDGFGTERYRPTQPLNNRIVTFFTAGGRSHPVKIPGRGLVRLPVHIPVRFPVIHPVDHPSSLPGRRSGRRRKHW